MALGLGILLSMVIPPMKSPDEGDHVRRAYLFSEGYWLLESQHCATEEKNLCRNGKSMSGGLIDEGLADYLDILHPMDFEKHSQNQLENSITNTLRWQGQERFVLTPGTGYYLPLVYLPQATGLKLGKFMDLSIDSSYRLARLFSLMTSILVIAAAFKIHRFPIMVMAALILPTSLFQAVSASIDPLSTALAVLSISCFLSIYEKGQTAPSWLFLVMASSLVIVCGSRAHMLPMLTLMVIASFKHRSKIAWTSTLLSIMATVAWLSVAIPSTIDLRVTRALSTGEIALFYLNNPSQLIKVIVSTLSNETILDYYAKSFLGNFFNSFLTTEQYTVITTIFLALFALSIPSPVAWKAHSWARVWVIAVGFGSALLAMIAMLLTWTDHPASVVQGVQGRYFLIPAILILTGLCSWKTTSKWLIAAQRGLLFSFLILGATFLVLRTLSTDYTPLMAIDSAAPSQAAKPGRLSPGPVLSQGSAITWSLRIPNSTSSNETDNNTAISRLGLLLGNYARDIDSQIKISAVSSNGSTWSKDFILKGTRDNDYFFIKVPPAEYKSIRIDVLRGDLPFTVWHVEHDSEHDDENAVVAAPQPITANGGTDSSFSRKQACLIAFGTDNRIYMTPGCPSPGF